MTDRSGVIFVSGIARIPKFLSIIASDEGATTIVPAVADKSILVLKITVSVNADVNVKFQSKPAGAASDLTGLFYCGAKGGIGLTYCKQGHFKTVSGESLDINLSGAVAVGGVVMYVEV